MGSGWADAGLVTGTFKEVIMVKWGLNGGTWSDRTGVHLRSGRDTRSACMQRKRHVRTQRESEYLQARKRGSPWNQPCWHLEVGLPASRIMRKIHFVAYASQSVVFCCGDQSRLICVIYVLCLFFLSWSKHFGRGILGHILCLFESLIMSLCHSFIAARV